MAILSLCRDSTDKPHPTTRLHVNHLSTALISLLLLPKMEATAKLRGSGSKPRLVIVSSEVHHWYQFDAKALAKKDLLKYLGSEEYCTPAYVFSPSCFMSRY